MRHRLVFQWDNGLATAPRQETAENSAFWASLEHLGAALLVAAPVAQSSASPHEAPGLNGDKTGTNGVPRPENDPMASTGERHQQQAADRGQLLYGYAAIGAYLGLTVREVRHQRRVARHHRRH